MRKTILFIAFLLMGVLTNAQTHFNYKGLLTENNTPLANSIITVKVTIEAHHSIPSPGTTTIWQEEHSGVHTDANGIFSIEIGAGTKIGGTATHFYDIDWRPLFNNIRYDIDIDTGSGYHNFVSNEYFKSVPYSNYSQKAGEASSLKKQYGYIEFASGQNKGLKFDVGTGYYLKNTNAGGFGFYYGSTMALKLHGSVGIEIPGYLELGGELHAPSSGDADMKAYAYGFVNASGTIVGGSDNFTVNRSFTGIYEITLTGVTGLSDADCFVIATPSINADNAAIRAYVDNGNHKIYVKTMGDTGATQVNKSFQFVVFKK